MAVIDFILYLLGCIAFALAVAQVRTNYNLIALGLLLVFLVPLIHSIVELIKLGG